ncbi:hypothetical protein HLB44_10200 [Aquincola sp. S2]|uniref:Uncharacterized protein n=1 Tax=Pseudaquabacterium terrae TaxID=2732868 RepID=A0ABX2EFF8_9BURK|nr:hypothetical protein [Aquabacterium terrae]NRF67355.1 hypothetical protein [Aquabacterium terrae]
MTLTIKMVREWVTSNDLYSSYFDVATYVAQGKDIFVPSQNKYPHVHVGKDFIVWSKSPTNHTDLIRGSMVYKQNIGSAMGMTTDFGMNQMLRYMNSQA